MKNEKINYRDVGYRIFNLRKKFKKDENNCISQKEFAEKLSVNNSFSEMTIYRVENGYQLPNSEMLIEINSIFSVSPDYIIFGSKAPYYQKLKSIYNLINLKDLNLKKEFINLCKNIAKIIYSNNPNEEDAFDEKEYFDEEDYLSFNDNDDKPCMSSLRIRHIRKINKMSIIDMANKFHVNHSTVHRWENAKFVPSIHTIINFCEVMDVPVNYILLGEIMSDHNELWATLKFCPYSVQKQLIDIFYETAKVFQDMHDKLC